MKTVDIVLVRVYITESSHLLKTIVPYLKKEAKIRGVSVFRAISGFGETGDHSASLMDLSLDLPLVIEFFDKKEKVKHNTENNYGYQTTCGLGCNFIKLVVRVFLFLFCLHCFIFL